MHKYKASHLQTGMSMNQLLNLSSHPNCKLTHIVKLKLGSEAINQARAETELGLNKIQAEHK